MIGRVIGRGGGQLAGAAGHQERPSVGSGRRRCEEAGLRDVEGGRRAVLLPFGEAERIRLPQLGPRVLGGGELERGLGHPHVRLFQGGPVRRQLPQPYAGLVREIGDPGQLQTRHPQCPVGLLEHPAPGPGQRGAERVPAGRVGIGGAHPCESGRIVRDEVLGAHLGEQPAPADHDQVVGGQRHLAHEVRGDEDGAALGGELAHQIADPEDALRVEAVDRLVEEEHLRIAEQGRRDAEALAHAEREALGALPGDVLEAHDAQDLVDPLLGDPGQLGGGQEVRAGPAAAVHGFGVEQGADVPLGVRQLAEGQAVDGDPAGAWAVQAQDQSHGGGLPGAVGPQESRHVTGPDLEGQVVDGGLRAEALRQADCLDHVLCPLPGRDGFRPRKG